MKANARLTIVDRDLTGIFTGADRTNCTRARRGRADLARCKSRQGGGSQYGYTKAPDILIASGKDDFLSWIPGNGTRSARAEPPIWPPIVAARFFLPPSPPPPPRDSGFCEAGSSAFRYPRQVSAGTAAAVGSREGEGPRGRHSADDILVRAGTQAQRSQVGDLHRRRLGSRRPGMRARR